MTRRTDVLEELEIPAPRMAQRQKQTVTRAIPPRLPSQIDQQKLLDTQHPGSSRERSLRSHRLEPEDPSSNSTNVPPFSFRTIKDPPIQKNFRPKNVKTDATEEQMEQPRLSRPPQRVPSPHRSAGGSKSPRQARLPPRQTPQPNPPASYLQIEISDRPKNVRTGAREEGAEKPRTSGRPDQEPVPRRPAETPQSPSQTAGRPRKTPRPRQHTGFLRIGTYNGPKDVQPSARDEEDDEELPRLSGPPDREAGRRRYSSENHLPTQDRERSRDSTVFQSAKKPSPPPRRACRTPNPSSHPRKPQPPPTSAAHRPMAAFQQRIFV